MRAYAFLFVAAAISAVSCSMVHNVRFTPLDADVTDPSEFWMPLWNDVPQEYCTTPRYPIVPTAGPIAVDVLHQLIPNGTVPNASAKPTNNWQKNLWGFEWSELPDGDQWGAIYPYPYVVSPKSGAVIIMYPGMPVGLDEDRAMIQGIVKPDPVPLGNKPIYNTSYPYMTMSGSFDMVLQVRNGLNPIIRNMTDLGVTIDYRNGDDHNRTVATLYLVKGSPFINVECFGAELALGMDGIAPPIISVDNLPPGQILTGTAFNLTSAQGPQHPEAQTWHAFFSNTASLNYASPPNGPVNLTAPYTGLVQIAVGELNDVEAAFLQSARGTYARDAAVEYDLNATHAVVRFRFDQVGSGDLKMLAIPHQTSLLNHTAHELHHTAYWCVKGNMSAISGNVWNMTYNLTSVGFGDLLTVEPSMHEGLLRAAMVDFELRIDRCPGDNDTIGYPGYMNVELYAYVRDLAMYTDIAIAFEALGEREYAKQITKKMMECIAPVLRSPSKAPGPCPLPINNTLQCVRNMTDVYFDLQWGGLVTGWYDRFAPHWCQCDLPGGPDACIGHNYCDNLHGWDAFSNYGNAFYNDHHLQYGYLIRNLAWAIYLQERKGADLNMSKAFVHNVTKQALAFARDIANPNATSDRFFTNMRHKDVYDGHSWAEGYDYSGRIVVWLNQQSGGEAVNAYYAVYLLGIALNDTNVRDWGRINAATESFSIDMYQHLSNRTADKIDQPTELIDQWGKCLPILFGNGASGATYYGPNPIFQCGITFLPVTPFSHDWIQPAWAQEAYEWIQWHNERVGECAFYDPLTMSANPCPGQYGTNWTGNEWGCCPTNDGFPDNQWRAWPDWYPTLYMLLAAYDPAKAWEYLQYQNISKPTKNLPLPYIDSNGKVVGYHRTLSMTTALFFVATTGHHVPHVEEAHPHARPHRH